MIEICTQQLLVLQVPQRHFRISSSWEKRKGKSPLSCLPLSFPLFLGKEVFLFVFGYPELQSIFCFTHTDVSENRYENAGLFKSLYTHVGSCTVWRSSWIFFFKDESSFIGQRHEAQQLIVFGNIYKVRRWIQQFQDFLFVRIRSLTRRASSRNYVDPGNRASSCHPL